jgi:hypothetical protein
MKKRLAAVVLVCCLLLLGVFLARMFRAGERRIPSKEALLAGEKMYRTGLLPSGAPMKAAVCKGAAIPGSTFACASCHTRSGLGTMEEGAARTPPINGARLYQPRYPNFPILTPAERAQMLPARFQVPPLRPAYTDATLAVAIRKGIDPSGRSLSPVMPRYELGRSDLKTLIAYLKQLSAQLSPGVSDSTIALATVITDEVTKEDRDAMLGPLELNIRSHNNLGHNAGNMGVMLSMKEMRYTFRQWTLAQWILTGSPETWPAQLEDYYAKSPVFALVGGISYRPWAPVHHFCETHQIPCLLPITDLPVVSTTDFYTLYFSEGYYQEGETAARYVAKSWDATHPASIVQVLSPGPEAEALASGFQDVWKDLGHGPVETITAKEGEVVTAALTRKSGRPVAGSIWLLWTGSESYPALESLAGLPERPALVLMSSTRLQGSLWDLPAKARAFTFVTYPFRTPGPTRVVPKMGGKPKMFDKEYRKNDRRVGSKTDTLVAIMNDRLLALERNFYRDYLVDLFSSMEAQYFTDYETLVFNPGQNYGSENCSIMQLSEGDNPTLLRKND